MANEFHFYEKGLGLLSSNLNTYVLDVATNIISAITPVATALITIYIMLWGIAMMMGKISEPIMDGVARLVRISIITSVALNIGYYNSFLADMLWNSPEALASYVTSGNAGSGTTQFLDQLMGQFYALGQVYAEKANAASGLTGIPDLGLMFVAVCLWTAGALATGYGAALLGLSKISLAVVLGVGPMYVLFTLFEPTKRFFDSWIGQVLNFVFIAMFTAAVIKLILAIAQAYMTDLGTSNLSANPAMDQALPAIIFALMGAIVLIQVPAKAAALAGGVAIGTLGAVGFAYGKATGGVSAMRPTNMRRSMNKARSDVRIATDAAKVVGGAPAALYKKVTGGTRNRVAKG